VADLALLVLTLLWGTTFLLVKNVLAGTSTGAFLALRFALAAAVLGLVWLVRRDRTTPGLARDGLLLGLTMLGGFAFQTLGLRYTTPARSGFITGMSVLLVPFVARFALARRVTPFAWMGVALAAAGLLALTRPFGGDIDAAVRTGDLLTAGCAISNALQIVYTSEWSSRHRLAPLVFVQVSVTFLGALLLLPLEPVRVAWGAPLAGTVLFLGLVMTAGSAFVMAWAQRHTTAVRAALIYSLEPVAAALFSNVVGGEPLGPWDWTGGGLIVAGVALGELGGALLGGGKGVAEPAP
jgi:drug/metabolite transporter (DMT)-like permease